MKMTTNTLNSTSHDTFYLDHFLNLEDFEAVDITPMHNYMYDDNHTSSAFGLGNIYDDTVPEPTTDDALNLAEGVDIENAPFLPQITSPVSEPKDTPIFKDAGDMTMELEGGNFFNLFEDIQNTLATPNPEEVCLNMKMEEPTLYSPPHEKKIDDILPGMSPLWNLVNLSEVQNMAPPPDSLVDHNYHLTKPKDESSDVDVWNELGIRSSRKRRFKESDPSPQQMNLIEYARNAFFSKQGSVGNKKTSRKRKKVSNSVETSPSPSEFYDSEASNVSLPKKRAPPTLRKVTPPAPCSSTGRIPKKTQHSKKGKQKKNLTKGRGPTSKKSSKVSKSESQRLAHNQNEKMRRTLLTQDLHVLRDLIPVEYFENLRNNNREKASKQKILTAAQAYVKYLIRNGHCDENVHQAFSEHHYRLEEAQRNSREAMNNSLKKYLAMYKKLRRRRYQRNRLRKSK